MLVNDLKPIPDNIIVKNLRKRKVFCSFEKSSDKLNVNTEKNIQHSLGSSTKKSCNKRKTVDNNVLKTNEIKSKKTRSLPNWEDEEIVINLSPPLKRSYGNKSGKTTKENLEVSPKTPRPNPPLNGPEAKGNNVSVEVSAKRTYKKQSFELLKSGTKTRPKFSNASYADYSTVFRTLPIYDFEPTKKRKYYRKKCRSPVDYKNKKPLEDESEGNSPFKVITPKRTYSKKTTKVRQPAAKDKTSSAVIEGDFSSLSSFSQDSWAICKPVTRPRGRPRSTPDPTYVPFSNEDTSSSSCTASSASSLSSSSSSSGVQVRRRKPPPTPRPKTPKATPWWLVEEPSPDLLSEYELQRQRNIQQNMQMLRQIFSEKGLEDELDFNSSEDCKPRKPYNRHPLPPPRPKSERLEHSQQLDFSKMFKKDAYD